MNAPVKTLTDLVLAGLARPVAPEIAAMADHLRRARKGVAAILAYGSCLRGASASDSLIDLYILAERDEDVSGNALSRWAAQILPPNVYYAELLTESGLLRCKYAVMTLAAFAGRMTPENGNPYFWARFSQPSALVYAANEAARLGTASAIVQAVVTMFEAACASAPANSDVLAIWQRGFEETYRTELRPEAGQRAQEIVTASEDFYRGAASLIAHREPRPISWPARRTTGKLLSIGRLAKAAFTFEGGASYAAWKIERHSGMKIILTPWQKRHPLVAGLMLLPRLLRRGALK